MSEDKARQIERRRRYLRRLRGEKKGVSPVVATLILILIAVAAAAALYLWLVVWQGNLTGGIGQPGARPTLTIGGSTSVYPFSELAVTQFQQNNSDVIISNNEGGTGAGMLAVCSGSINIGAASTPETPAGLVASDGCPSSGLSTIQITTIAYDAVDVIVPVANVHGLVSVSYDTLAAIYDGSTVASGSTASLQAPSIDTVALTAVPYTTATFVTAGKISSALVWDEIPAAVDGAALAGTTEQVESAGVTAAFTTACTAAGYTNDICATTPGTTATPCGWSVCAGGSGAGAAAGEDSATIVTVARSDAAGSTQTFESRLLGATSSNAFASSFTGLGFSGCGTNNLISDCGLVADKTAVGDPGAISTVASTPDAIGYASDGLARASSSGVTCQGVATAACGIAVAEPGQVTGATQDAVQPSLGSTGSIAGGVVNGGFGTPGLTTTLTIDQSYSGARPFEFVSLQPYTGVAQEFITFVLDPANNIALASEAHEVSVYSI